MAIVKLNKLQRIPENMSQLLSNETHMPKNLYQMSSEKSSSLDRAFIGKNVRKNHFSTMNASYGNKITIPDGFASVLGDFTREILRDQPSDVYTYGAEYFQALAAASTQTASNHLEGGRKIDMASLEARIIDMFNAADEEGKGYLSRAQATGVVQNVASELSFSEAQVQYIMTEADENNDGMIDFNEFQPLLLELVQLLIAKQDVEEKLLQNEAIVEDRLLHGMDRTTLNQLLLSIFQSADDDQSGFLNRVQFQNALKSADLGLTRKEINGLLHAVDENEDGVISYSEFAPVAFDLCVQIYARQIAHESLPTGEKEIAEYFEQLFSSADVNGAGRLAHHQLGDLLRASDLGMSKVQMHTVLGEAVSETKEIRKHWIVVVVVFPSSFCDFVL
jgi:Ca2+-binding EF-hand superfamily protein